MSAPARRPRDLVRCPWAGDDPLYVAYHDEEWGVPLHDDRRLFELLVLEGFQAGLAWITILRKREAFRRAFRGFDPERVARFGERDVARLLGDAGIVRHRGKIEGAIASARAFRELVRAEGSFDRFLWSFVGGAPLVNRPAAARDVPARTPASEALSRALRTRGFAFVGPTTCYAFMQAAGLVDDHLAACFRARRRPARDGRARAAR
jgi:DNA-3-methyladenine glycosylase I